MSLTEGFLYLTLVCGICNPRQETVPFLVRCLAQDLFACKAPSHSVATYNKPLNADIFYPSGGYHLHVFHRCFILVAGLARKDVD